MKAYKLTDPDGSCRGHKFEVGKTYRHDGAVEMCRSGFHACRELNECFRFYAPLVSRVFEVDMRGDILHDNGGKSVCSEIKILKELQWTDVTPLSALTALEQLYLRNTQVSDLTPLSALTALKWLDLENTQVSKKQVEWLREQLPNCNIYR